MSIFQNKSANKNGAGLTISRHVWVGAAIGLYFGWFFRPVREPSWVIVLFLGVLITLALSGWQLFRRKQENRTAGQILRHMPLTFAKYAVILSFLEARHFAYDLGGRVAVIVMMTVLGALGGVLMSRQNQQEAT